jgi:aminopeptidase N
MDPVRSHVLTFSRSPQCHATSKQTNPRGKQTVTNPDKAKQTSEKIAHTNFVSRMDSPTINPPIQLPLRAPSSLNLLVLRLAPCQSGPMQIQRNILALVFCLVTLSARTEVIDCRYQHIGEIPGDAVPERKYAPSKEVDILHLALDVTPNFRERSVAGTVTLRFKPIAKPLTELKLDAVDLSVQKLESSEAVQGWQATEKNLIITFEKPLPADKEATVTITYSAVPRHGLYFRTPELGYKPEDEHLWTQGETTEARYWFPCYDSPNEKFTSEITCHVPTGMVVLSNGRQVSETQDAAGLKAVRWAQEKPHANYLICLCAGYFKKVESKYKDVPLAFWTPASQVEQAALSFKDTREIMAFFEDEIGIPYPWAKYYQVVVDDFTAGGMENTSITTLTDQTLHTPATENLQNSQGLVAHEMAHQWFGDLVTCKDWSHLWLNEGFATYYDGLFEGHKHGKDSMNYGFYGSAKGILAQANDTNAIVRRRIKSPDEMFDYLAYPKGSWVLRMLRAELGDDLYRQSIKTYIERYQYKNAVTENLNAVIEELSGRSFDRFFDQWVYHAHHPELTVAYSWDEKTKLAKVTIAQTQKLSEDVLLFDFPLSIRFKGKFGTQNQSAHIRRQSVRVDPELELLASINFTPPQHMLYAQLADKSDMLGRLRAVEQLSGRREALAKLKDVLNNDPFYGVRIAASQSMRAIQTDEALEALLNSTKQADARVRKQVATDVGGFYREASYAGVLRLLDQEKNPEIQAVYIHALGAYHQSEVRGKLLDYLNSESYRNHLADAAIRAIRAQDDPSYIEPLLACLQNKEKTFTTQGFGAGLIALSHLARNEDKKDRVREFLLERVNHKKSSVQLATINALGTLGDPKAIAVLEKFTSLPRETRERAAAEKAIASLREAKKPSVELGALRTEVTSLQKENRELRKDFDSLKKQFETLVAKPENKAKTNRTASTIKGSKGS